MQSHTYVVTFHGDKTISKDVHDALARLAGAIANEDDVSGFVQARTGLNLGVERIGRGGDSAGSPLGLFCVGYTLTSDPNEPDSCTIRIP